MRARLTSVIAVVLLVQGAVALTASSTAATRPGAAGSAASAQAPGTFVDIAPVTVLDTAAGVGAPGPIHMHSVTTVHVAGLGRIPATGSPTLSMAITISGAHAFGTVTMYPAGATRPHTATAAVRWGEPTASTALVPVGAGGDVELANPTSTPLRVTIQVIGYYLDGIATGGGTYTPLAPTRVLDTADDPWFRGGLGYIPPGRPLLRLQLAGAAGVPSTGVSSVELEVTAQAASKADRVDIDSNGVDFEYNGNGASVTFGQHSVSTTLITVELASDGTIELRKFSGGRVQLGVDVVGYFHAGTPSLPGAFVVQTVGPPPFDRVAPNSAVTVALAGYEGLPAQHIADVVLLLDTRQAEVPSDHGQGGVAVYPDGGMRPANAQLDYGNGAQLTNAITTRLGTDGALVLRNTSTLTTGASLHFLTLGYHISR